MTATKQKRCMHCHTWMRYTPGDTSVACGKCGAKYSITTRSRSRGNALQLGVLRVLRQCLAADPRSCKSCSGTGIRNAVATERASVRAARVHPRPCPRCKGEGVLLG
jgi:hypothetical protein